MSVLGKCRLDESGRIIPMSDAEHEARWAAAVRALDAISRGDSQSEDPQLAERVMRGIDEGRPERKLFEGIY